MSFNRCTKLTAPITPKRVGFGGLSAVGSACDTSANDPPAAPVLAVSRFMPFTARKDYPNALLRRAAPGHHYRRRRSGHSNTGAGMCVASGARHLRLQE